MSLEREVKDLKKILLDPRINLSGLCKTINRPGLSRASLVNKMNEKHVCNLNQEDVRLIKKSLKKLNSDISKTILFSFINK